MAAITTSWLLGAIKLESSATIVVNGGSNAVIAAGTYYLYDASASISLLDAILTAVSPFMTTPAIFVAVDRYIRVTAGVSFSWAIPAALQDALGFGAAIGSTTSATAASVSNLLFSPGYCATTIGHRTGTSGHRQPTVSHTASPSGLTQRTTLHGTVAILNHLSWRHVVQGRAWSSGEDTGLPGEYQRFIVDVLEPGLRYKHYEAVSEDSAASSSVVYPAPFGPYVARNLKRPWWDRSVRNADTNTNVELEGTIVSEIS